MTTLLDLWDIQDEIDRCGMRIYFNLPVTELMYYRICYGNKYTKNTEDGVTLANRNIKSYSSEIMRQLSNANYYYIEDQSLWSSDCFYVYLKKDDQKKEYPCMKFRIHPNEVVGWSPQKEIDNILKILRDNPYTMNVRLVYSTIVYDINDEQRLEILKSAESQIIEWLAAYKELHRKRLSNAPKTFDRIFGIKRLSNEHLSFHDYVT